MRGESCEKQALEPETYQGCGEVDKDDLHQKRSPPEDVYVELGGEAQDAEARDLEQREHEAEDHPEGLREEREQNRDQNRLQDGVRVLENQPEVQVALPDGLQAEGIRVELYRELERQRAAPSLRGY